MAITLYSIVVLFNIEITTNRTASPIIYTDPEYGCQYLVFEEGVVERSDTEMSHAGCYVNKVGSTKPVTSSELYDLMVQGIIDLPDS